MLEIHHLRVRFRYFFLLVILCIGAISVGGFQTRQAVALTVLATGLGTLVWLANTREPLETDPYYIWIQPDWVQILTDLGVIASPQAFQSVCSSIPNGYHVLLHGLKLTIVHRSPNGEKQLIFWNDHQSFSTTAEIRIDLSPLKLDSVDTLDRCESARRVEFFLRERNGIEMGLKFPHAWFAKAHKLHRFAACATYDLLTGRDEVVLACLSYREFDIYWSLASPSSALDLFAMSFKSNRTEKFRAETPTRIQAERERLGWQTEDDNPIPERDSSWLPTRIKHEYFTVWHQGV